MTVREHPDWGPVYLDADEFDAFKAEACGPPVKPTQALLHALETVRPFYARSRSIMASDNTEIAPLQPSVPAPEEITAAAVMDAVRAAFNPHGNRELNMKQAIDVCAALIAFLDAAEKAPPRTFKEWREAIENLEVTLGKPRP